MLKRKGKSVTDAASSDAMVDADILCKRCAYNLRNLPVEGLCPECAHPIDLSLRGDELGHSDRSWIRRIRIGARLIILDLGGSLLMWGLTSSPWAIARPSINVLQWIGPSQILVYGLATWLISTRDPSEAGESSYGGMRRATRVSVIATVAVIISQILYFRGRMIPLPNLWVTALSLSQSLTMIAVTFCSLRLLAALAARIPAPHLTWGFQFLKWFKSFGLFVTELIFALPMIGLTRAPFHPSSVSKVLPFTNIALTVITLIMAIQFQRRVGNALSTASIS